MCFRRKPKVIIPDLNISSKKIIELQKFKKGRIYFGTQIKIPRKFALVFISNKDILDTLYEGDTNINIKMLPKATKKLGLYKVDKKCRGPKYFEVDGYFVNLNMFEGFKWETTEYTDLEDKDYGEYKSSCFGELDFKVNAPEKLLKYISSELEIIYANQVEKLISNYINERIVRILNKANPTAKSLYLKDQCLMKLIYEKLAELLNEIGIDLDGISLTETRFPPKILNDLKSTTEQPAIIRGWGKMTFEDWQTSNPSVKIENKPKFVTITPTGKNGPFFKESMAPYFFDEEEADTKKETITSDTTTGPIWKGVDETKLEEQSKQLVDLNDSDN